MFASEEIDAQFCYEGKDLGADCREGRTVFKVWSPLAERLCLRLYKDGTSPAYIEKEMERGEKGVWHREFPESWGPVLKSWRTGNEKNVWSRRASP